MGFKGWCFLIVVAALVINEGHLCGQVGPLVTDLALILTWECQLGMAPAVVHIMPDYLRLKRNRVHLTPLLCNAFILKVNTAVQLILVAASLAAPVFNYADSIYLQILWCCTAFTTAASAYSYYHYGRKTVQVIKGK